MISRRGISFSARIKNNNIRYLMQSFLRSTVPSLVHLKVQESSKSSESRDS
jgi:hypothetical protein